MRVKVRLHKVDPEWLDRLTLACIWLLYFCSWGWSVVWRHWRGE